MSDDLLQIHLVGGRLCGRGVRYRELTANEVREVEEEAYKAVLAAGDEKNQVKYTNEKWRAGAIRMLVSVTDPADKLDGAAWKSVSLQTLTMSGAMNFDALFPRKQDQDILGAAYGKLHDLSAADVEAVLGKACTVVRE